MPTFLQDNRMLAWILAGVAFLVAFVLILKIVEIAVDLRRRLPRGSRSRQMRLGFVESFDLDGERQLLLVRRDNIEHLLMIGGPNDVLVESGILRVEPREGRLPRASEPSGIVAPPAAVPHHAPAPEEAPAAPPPLPPALPPLTPVLPPHPLAAEAAPHPLEPVHPLEPALPLELPHPLEPQHPLEPPAPPVAAPPPPLEAPVPPAAAPAERPPSRFPLPPRVGPSFGGPARTPAFTPSPRFTPAGPSGAPGAGDQPAKPRFVMPPLARRAAPPPPPVEQIPPEAPPAPPVAAPLPVPPEPPVAPPPPPLSSLPPLPPFTPPAAPEPEPPAPAPRVEPKRDPDFEPLESLEEEMAKLLGRPLNK